MQKIWWNVTSLNHCRLSKHFNESIDFCLLAIYWIFKCFIYIRWLFVYSFWVRVEHMRLTAFQTNISFFLRVQRRQQYKLEMNVSMFGTTDDGLLYIFSLLLYCFTSSLLSPFLVSLLLINSITRAKKYGINLDLLRNGTTFTYLIPLICMNSCMVKLWFLNCWPVHTLTMSMLWFGTMASMYKW